MLFYYRTMLITLVSLAITNPVLASNSTSAHAVTAPKLLNQQASHAEESKININQATEKEFIKVRGLNATKAKAIVRYRNKHGDFKDLDTLAKIRGFTRMKENDLKQIKDQLSIN